MKISVQHFGVLGARPSRSLRPASRESGFTLVELLIAAVAMAILLFAIHTAFFAALNLRQRTEDALESSLPREEALQTIQHDLANLVGSTNTNAVFFGPLQSINQTNMLPGQVGPDFYTSAGELDGMVPWGNVEKIDYLLAAPTNGATGPGQDLIRAVTRNLLPVNPPPMPEEKHAILSGVQSLNFLYYDGTQWESSWDSTQQTNLPLAIKVQIQMAAHPGTLAAAPPLELVVPIDVLLSTNPIVAAQ